MANRYKPLVAFTIFLFVCLAVSLFFWWQRSPTNLAKTPIDTKATTTNPTRSHAYKLVDKGECDGITDLKLRANCLDLYLLQQYGITKNPTNCLKMVNYKDRETCLKMYVTSTNRAEFCQRLTGNMQEMCSEELGMKQLGLKFCDEIKDEPNEKQECVDRTKAIFQSKIGKTEDCSNIKTLEYSYLCEINAMKAGGKDCEVFTDKAKHDLCVSRVIYDRTVTKADCDLIPDIRYKKVCQLKYDNIGNIDYKFDDDGDGLNNNLELWINTDPFNKDTDGDGLSDYDEYMIYKTNPTSADTDGDGISDAEEIKLGLDPEVPNKPGDKPVVVKLDLQKWWLDTYSTDFSGTNWRKDSDGDGLIDLDEIFYGTDPLKADTDGDGAPDGEEIKNLTNPLGPGDLDFDGDGLTDKQELTNNTNPFLIDTNGDGLNDAESIKQGVDPVSNDSDNDGINNAFEIKNGLNPLKADTDGDGLTDGEEANKYHTNPLKPDTDGDGHSDGEEVKAGYNPCGDGLLVLNNLMTDCAKYNRKR
jgi:hypothetical protein